MLRIQRPDAAVGETVPRQPRLSWPITLGGALGDTMTIIGACRDALRTIRAEPGAKPEELKPPLDEVEILSGKLDENRHDVWRGYVPLVYEAEASRPCQ